MQSSIQFQILLQYTTFNFCSVLLSTDEKATKNLRNLKLWACPLKSTSLKHLYAILCWGLSPQWPHTTSYQRTGKQTERLEKFTLTNWLSLSTSLLLIPVRDVVDCFCLTIPDVFVGTAGGTIIVFVVVDHDAKITQQLACGEVTVRLVRRLEKEVWLSDGRTIFRIVFIKWERVQGK